MADPVIADLFRVQAVFQMNSGLPEDVVVNNFVFRNDEFGAAGGNVADRVRDALNVFYGQVPEGQGNRVADFMSAIFSSVEYRIYDLGEQPPRTRVVRAGDAAALPSTAGGQLPNEVAACLTWSTAVNGPRGRGRIFLGPLRSSVLEETDTGPMFTAAFRGTVAAAARKLVRDNDELLTLMVLSQANGSAAEVTGGWIDDSPDTQRRRGTKASGRTVIPA